MRRIANHEWGDLGLWISDCGLEKKRHLSVVALRGITIEKMQDLLQNWEAVL
ncbi:hypothetical protein HZA56_17675 [Candidatus Poribacteria bacterium]|nr:hypothetical protein [Candidatus Poribacteria bacterium]